MTTEPFSSLLQGGDRRSIGRSDDAVDGVRRAPGRFDELWACLAHKDPIVRMRAADALEKITRSDASSLACHKQDLLAETFDDGTPEVRWHLIAMVRRLPLDAAEAARVFKRLDRLLREDASRIVKTAALQTAFELQDQFPDMQQAFAVMLAFALASPWPSVRARARKLSMRAQPNSK
jgi:vesicle coat complex subunit